MRIPVAPAASTDRQELDEVRRSLESQIDDLRSELRNPDRTFMEMLFGLALRPDEPVAVNTAVADEPSEVVEAWRLQIATNVRVLRTLEWAAERRFRLGDRQAVLNLAQAAGEWGCSHHPGLFGSAVIEDLLRRTGRVVLPDGLPPRSPTTGEQRVLHVLTSAHGIGGHTRLVERWMRFDGASRHSIVLTSQEGQPVPDGLAAAATDGVRVLSTPTPLHRVTELAGHLGEADLVMLHVHPHDAVAVAALGVEGRPPAVFLDHGDHQFWLGGGGVDVVASLRPSGQEVALSRRGVRDANSVVLPLPFEASVRRQSRDAARAALRLPTEAVVLLTMASAYKYADGTFAESVSAVLRAVPRAHLVAVGPEASSLGGWQALAENVPGRVHLLGPLLDPSTPMDAADVYLDSFPFSSLTSLLETASLGNPVVSRRRPGSGPMGLDDPGFELPTVQEWPEWVALAISLASDPARARSEGAALAAKVLEAHGEAVWGQRLAQTYALARLVSGPAAHPPADVRLTLLDGYLAAFQRAARLGHDPEVLFAAHGLVPGF